LSRRQLVRDGTGLIAGPLAAGRLGLTGGRQAPGAPLRDVGLERPRTRLANAVEQLLRNSSPRFLVDHCHRSFELAMLIAAAGGVDLDVEVLFAGVLLHDLGLTSRFHSPTVRFEVAGANAARDLVRAHGMDPAQAEKVWDVAALHATGGISDSKSAETAGPIGLAATSASPSPHSAKSRPR